MSSALTKAELAHTAQIDMLDDLLLEGAAKLLVTLAADAEEFDFLALGDQRLGVLAGKAHDRGVEGAAQAALAGTDQQQMDLVPAGADQKRRRAGRTRGRSRDVADHRLHLGGIRPRRFGGDLRAAQPGGRHHLHRLGDLLRRLGRGDADPHVFQ